MTTGARSVFKSARALDWYLAGVLIIWGLALMIPGASIGPTLAGYFSLLRIVSETTWGEFMVAVGLMRVLALIVNGRAAEGSPAVRAISAAIGAAIWAQFFYAFAEVSLNSSMVTNGAPLLLCALGADIWCCSRAGYDFIVARRKRLSAKSIEPLHRVVAL